MLSKLAKFDTPTICNVIELFDVIPRNRGYMDGRVRSCFPELPPMVGYAATACFRSDAPPAGGDAYGSIQKQLEQFQQLPGPPVVVFQDLDDPPVAAVFGEVMCSTYKAFGSAGLVTSGAGRDIEQVHALKYPIFTTGTICSHGYCHILHIGLPVRVGGLMVNTGDLLHGDANGVTSIPLFDRRGSGRRGRRVRGRRRHHHELREDARREESGQVRRASPRLSSRSGEAHGSGAAKVSCAINTREPEYRFRCRSSPSTPRSDFRPSELPESRLAQDHLAPP